MEYNIEEEFIVKSPAIQNLFKFLILIGVSGLTIALFVCGFYQGKDSWKYILFVIAIWILFWELVEGEVRLSVNGNHITQKIFHVIFRREFEIQELEEVVVDEKGSLTFYQDGKKLFKIYRYFYNAPLLMKVINKKGVPMFYMQDGNLMTEEEFFGQDPHIYSLKYGKPLEKEDTYDKF